jgi:nucleolar protein 9
MPRENKKRGRRVDAKDKKRKFQDGAEIENDVKRPRMDDSLGFVPATRDGDDAEMKFDGVEPGDSHEMVGEQVFFGLLTEEEQEYFARAGELLELNNIEGGDERRVFVRNLYKEMNGKEMKVACSQSCSRLMERLILVSGPEELKDLWTAWSGQ